MIKTIANLDPTNSFRVKGTISIGCRAVKAMCKVCGGKVIGLKLNETSYVCSKCDSIVEPIANERQFTCSLPYFLVPDEIKEAVGNARPTELQVVPAYASLERTIPNSYAYYTQNGSIYCTGNGETAKRYSKDTKGFVNIACPGEDCRLFQPQKCRISGTFYFYVPDVDILSGGYKLVTKSRLTIINIVTTLKKLTSSNGCLSRVPLTMRIAEKKKSDGKMYRVVELIPPAVSMSEFATISGASAAISAACGR